MSKGQTLTCAVVLLQFCGIRIHFFLDPHLFLFFFWDRQICITLFAQSLLLLLYLYMVKIAHTADTNSSNESIVFKSKHSNLLRNIQMWMVQLVRRHYPVPWYMVPCTMVLPPVLEYFWTRLAVVLQIICKVL